MRDKDKISKKLLYNDNLMKIISLALAILFWFIVVINVSPDYKRTVLGVPVDINENTSMLTSLGLHVIDNSAERVSVEVAGPRNLIGKLGTGDFSITPNLSDVSKSGTYNIELSATLKTPDSRIRITKVDPSYITVHFDTQATKVLPVEVRVKDFKLPDGYLMQTPQATPSQITISGPTSELSSVQKAVANVSISDGSSKTTALDGDVTLLDSGGRELNLDHVTLSSKKVKITVPILKTANVALKPAFTNVPAGFDSSNIAYTVSPSSLMIAGNKEKISSISEISLGSIDFRTLDLSSTMSFGIPNIDGVVNIENINTASVSIELKNTASKMMSTNSITVTNVPAGYKVISRTKHIDNIKLFGPSSEIAGVNTVMAVIDMSGTVSGTGQYEVPVSFSVPGETGFWTTGNYTAVVSVSKTR